MKIKLLSAYFLGIDVGKSSLHCCLLDDSGQQLQASIFSNSKHGIKKLLDWLTNATDGLLEETCACLEQTGHYSRPVAKALHAKLQSVFVVNPRQVKAFSNRKLRRCKTDTADAKIIAQFISQEFQDLHAWRPMSPEQEHLQEVSRHIEALTNQLAKLKNQLQATTNPIVKTSLNKLIKTLIGDIKGLRKIQKKTIQSTEKLSTHYDLLNSIPGLGDISCQILLAELPDITRFTSARQLAAWAGVTPRHFESGTSGMRRTPITKVGSTRLRKALYLPAITAMRYNPILKAFSEKLKAKGKTGKEIVVALIRKLLHQIYGVIISNQPFNPNHLSGTASD